MKTRNSALLLLAGILCLFFAASSASLSIPQEAVRFQKPLQHEVSVTLKLIQVYVTDNKGNPVKDLEKSDFEIFDSGVQKHITEFEKHVSAAKPENLEAPPATPPVSPTKLERKIFLFFDFGFNDRNGLVRAKKAGLYFVDAQLRPTDEVAVLSYSTTKGLVLHEYLTRDQTKVRQVIGDLGVERITGRAEKLERFLEYPELGEEDFHTTMDSLSAARRGRPPGTGGESDLLLEQKIAFQNFSQTNYKHQVFQYFETLKDMAKALRYVPGVKTIVLFSAGVARIFISGSTADIDPLIDDPFKSPESIATYTAALETMVGSIEIRNEYEALTQELKASGSSVFAVDLTNPKRASADPKSGDLEGTYFLKQISKETGGTFYLNSQDPKKIMEDIQNLTASYYVLGYAVDEKWDGKFHDVKISVKRKGCQTRSAAGYFNPKPFAEYTDYEKLVHLIDLALSDTPQMQSVAELPIKAFPVSVYGTTSPRAAALIELPEGQRNILQSPRIEAVVFLFDEQKNLFGLKRTELNLGGWDRGPAYLSGIFPLRPGSNMCKIVLRNLDTGRGARASATVNTQGTTISSLKFSPPFWLKAEKNKNFRTSLSKDPLSAIYPFSPTEYTPIMDEVGAGTARIYGVVPLAFAGVQEPDIVLSARIVDQATGQPRNLPLSILQKSPGDHINTYFIELTLGELPSGSYFLYLFIQEKLGVARVYVSSFRIQ